MYTLSVGVAVCSCAIPLHFEAFFADNALVCFVPDLFNRPVVVGLFSLTWRARPQNKLVRRLYNIVRRDISSRMLFAGYFQSVLSSDSEQAIL